MSVPTLNRWPSATFLLTPWADRHERFDRRELWRYTGRHNDSVSATRPAVVAAQQTV